TIAFEADHAGLQSVDDYINGKTDQAPMSVHYRPLFDWLRVFNKTISTKEKVHLYGLEMRSFAPAISRLLARYPDMAIADRKLFERIAATRFDKIDAPSLSEFRSAVGRLPEDLERIMLLQLIGNYRDFISLDSKIGVRDRFMATNANAIIKAGADGKLIIWAHNGHVAKTSLYRVPAMGQYLSNQHGNSYYVIATDINQGKVSVRIAPGKNRPLSDWQGLYYPPVSDSKGYEYYFSKCRYKNFILEFNEASVQPLLRDFLRRPKEMRMIGGLSTPVNKKLSMSDNFDMLVYFDTSSSL
ncbi:MAG: erythromycin esterase family protein, partial [Pedobacter sp.]